MVDRVSASIEIGGKIALSDYTALAALIAAEGLSTEWDGEPFEGHHPAEGQSLRLYAQEVAWGRFEQLEAKCIALALPFVRWSGGYPGQWGSHRLVFTGEGESEEYPVDESDHAMISRGVLTNLGSIEAVLAWFDAADFAVPALTITGAVAAEAGAA